MKKTISFIISMLGIVLFLYGSNILNRASFQEGRITQQESTNQQGRPILGPVRRAARNEQKENQQQQLNQKEQQVLVSEANSSWLQGIGIVLFLIGMGGFFFRAKRR